MKKQSIRNQKLNLFKYSVFLTQLSAITFLVTINPAVAESIENSSQIKKIHFIRDSFSHRKISSSAKDLFLKDTSIDITQSNLTSITGIKIDRTNKGLKVILTTEGQRLVPIIFPEGNNLVIDILDATLAPAIKDGFAKTNPAPGIKQVKLTKLDESIVRLTIAGEIQTPSAEIIPSQENSVVLNIVTTSTVQTEIDEEIEIIVTDEVEDNYYVPNTRTATRTDIPLRDLPQSVQIIPQKVIEDRQAISLEEIATNSSGVIFSGNNLGRGADIAIRGFNRSAILRDGFRVYNRAAQGIPEIANLERVEIVKGPASVVFGESEPGGLINLVSKQPLSEPFYNLQLQLGNDTFVRLPFDLSGSLTEDASLKYRLNTLYQSEDSFRDFDNGFERFFVAPTLAWQIADSTDLSFNLEYTHEIRPIDSGTATIDGEPANIPREQILNNPSDKGEREFINTGYTFEHRFNEDWKIRNAFRYISNNYDTDDDTLAIPFLIDENTGIVTSTFVQEERAEDSFTLYTNVEGDFATGKIKHNLLLGIDINHSQTDLNTRFDPFPLNSSNPNLAFIDIFNPDYDAFLSPEAEAIDFFNNDDVTNNRLGIYLQDKIDLLDSLILLAGLRYDTFDQTTINNLDNTEVSQDSDAFTPRIGIVYQPIKAISLYSNYSQSFNPQPFLYNRSADGSLLEPESGEGFEVGVKAEIIPNRLSATAAYFKITKENVVTEDRFNPFAAVVIGEQQSQGIELDLTGEIQPGWNIIASYAYIDSEITEDDNPDLIGSRLPNIPENNASLWSTYEIRQGNLKGLGLGIGLNYVGERQGGLPNSFELDSYILTNAALFYNRQKWQLRLNFDNLFDVNFIEAADTSSARKIYVGRPFVVRGSIAVQL
ncbi:MAG: TonB-dependent siderophore receptor [Cyanobacteria bacterium P01_G01_bin.49]